MTLMGLLRLLIAEEGNSELKDIAVESWKTKKQRKQKLKKTKKQQNKQYPGIVRQLQRCNMNVLRVSEREERKEQNI